MKRATTDRPSPENGLGPCGNTETWPGNTAASLGADNSTICRLPHNEWQIAISVAEAIGQHQHRAQKIRAARAWLVAVQRALDWEAHS